MSFNRDTEDDEYSLIDALEIGAENFVDHLNAAPLVILRSREGNIVLANIKSIAQFNHNSAGSTKLSAHEWSQLNASEKLNKTRFGTHNNPTLYASVVTHDLPRSPQPQKNLSLQDVRKIKTKNMPQCYKYVILEDGKLIITDRVATMISPDNKKLVRQAPVKHPRVAATGMPSNKISKNWPLVAAAGDVYIKNGKIVKIDDRSGHYLPKVQPQLVEHVFRREGFKEVKNTFISMTHTLNEWRAENPPKRIRGELVFRDLQTYSSPSALNKPLVMSDIDNLRYQQQANPLKRLLNIPNKTATINAEIASTYLRNKFWSERIITPITPTDSIRWVPVIKTAAPFLIGGAFMGVEVWRQHQINPQGHYIRDGIIGFAIDSVVYYPLFAALGPAGIPLILAASLPDCEAAFSAAFDNVIKNRDKADMSIWEHVAQIDNLTVLGFGVFARRSAQAVLRPFAKKSEEIKGDCRKLGILDTPKPAPVRVQSPAEFKAMLDSQPFIKTTPIKFTYSEFAPQLGAMPNNSYGPDLTNLPWASLGPNSASDSNNMNAASKHANFNAARGLDTEMSNIILNAPNLNATQAAAVSNLLANRSPTNYKAPNLALGASTVMLQSISMCIVVPVVAGLAYAYERGRAANKAEGEKYLKEIDEKAHTAQHDLDIFHHKLAEINNLPEDKNANDLNERYKKYDEALPLLEKAKDSFKSLSDHTNQEHREATNSFLYDHSLDSEELNEVWKRHRIAKKVAGTEHEGTGLYATRNLLYSNKHAIAKELPNQVIVDGVNALFDEYNRHGTTMQTAIQEFKVGKISASDVCNTLQAFVAGGDKLQNESIPTALSKLRDAPHAVNIINDCDNKSKELKTSATSTVAAALFNKYFIEKDVNGHVKAAPVQSHAIISLLKPYLAIPEVSAIADLMQATMHDSYIKRCEQVERDISTQTKSLIDNLKTICELQAEADAVADKPEHSQILQGPLQRLQATAKIATLKEYQQFVNTDKQTEAKNLLVQSLLSANEQQELIEATEKFLAEQYQQKVTLCIDTAAQTVRLAQNALNLITELIEPTQAVSAPSIPTARMRPISSLFWQAPPVKEQTISENITSVIEVFPSLQIKKPADVKVTNFRL